MHLGNTPPIGKGKLKELKKLLSEESRTKRRRSLSHYAEFFAISHFHKTKG